MSAITKILPARYRGLIQDGVGTGLALLIMLIYFAIFIGSLLLGSFTLDAWFGIPDWLSPFLMAFIALVLPEVAFVFAIAGFWYLP